MDFLADFKDYFTHNSIFCVGLLLLAGYCAGEIAKRFRLPSITGYIVAGLLVGESVSGLIPVEVKHYLENVTRVALALIAVTIGAEFNITKLKKSGLKIFLLTVFEACFASISVFCVFRLLGFEIRYALILGAIAAATAPAATVIIAKQLKAKGEFVEYLFGVVAFDDAVCIILFSIVFAVIAPLLTGSVMAGNGVVISRFVHAVEEIGFSFVLGVLGGFLLHLFTRKASSQKELLLVSIATVLVVTAVSVMLHLSLLITNMALGAVLVNISDKSKKIFTSIIPITPPLFAMFFVLAGSELDIGIFSKGIVVFFGIMYVAARFAGKYAGVFLASLIARVPSRIWKYLGFCLFPQAGVAIGLVLFVQTSPVLKNAAPEVQTSLVLIVNIVLLSIFISELIGPSISKFGILRGAERD